MNYAFETIFQFSIENPIETKGFFRNTLDKERLRCKSASNSQKDSKKSDWHGWLVANRRVLFRRRGLALARQQRAQQLHRQRKHDG